VSYSHKDEKMCPILTGMNKCVPFSQGNTFVSYSHPRWQKQYRTSEKHSKTRVLGSDQKHLKNIFTIARICSSHPGSSPRWFHSPPSSRHHGFWSAEHRQRR